MMKKISLNSYPKTPQSITNLYKIIFLVIQIKVVKKYVPLDLATSSYNHRSRHDQTQ